ncbi:MAG: hypothetical protein PHV36_10240 [Elusimicrobiales bacterium]|nr:hypothetical protein [Elusimicrobiales bacterium]
MPGRLAFYLHSPSGDIGHAVHLLRLLAEIKRSRGSRGLIFLRAPSIYPYGLFKKYGRVIPLPAAPSAASGRRLALALLKFRPAALVTEFFPFGRAECLPEIKPLLEAASACGAKKLASVPMPYFTAPERGLKELAALCAGYDKLLVHSPEGADLPYMAKAIGLERRISAAAFLSLFRGLRGKIVFTGYVLPAKPAARRAEKNNFVLVTRGGGSTSDSFFEAAIGAASISDIPFRLVAGPATPPRRLAHFRRLAASGGGKAEIIGSPDGLQDLMAGAAVCLSTAGGSVYEMLALRKKMVLAPYCGSKMREHSDQLARAWLMRDLAGAALLLPADLAPEKIAAAVRARLAKPFRLSKSVKPSWFLGARKSAKIICGL